jgi:hypothetical protein
MDTPDKFGKVHVGCFGSESSVANHIRHQQQLDFVVQRGRAIFTQPPRENGPRIQHQPSGILPINFHAAGNASQLTKTAKSPPDDRSIKSQVIHLTFLYSNVLLLAAQNYRYDSAEESFIPAPLAPMAEFGSAAIAASLICHLLRHCAFDCVPRQNASVYSSQKSVFAHLQAKRKIAFSTSFHFSI